MSKSPAFKRSVFKSFNRKLLSVGVGSLLAVGPMLAGPMVADLSAQVAPALRPATGSGSAAVPGVAAARLETFTNTDGQSFVAMSVMPAAANRPAAPVARDIVVLFDTSASQVNEFREKGLAALDFFLASLDAADRVKLLAVDINAVPLTNTFVAPNGPEIQAALTELRARTPLTPLEAPLQPDGRPRCPGSPRPVRGVEPLRRPGWLTCPMARTSGAANLPVLRRPMRQGC